MRILCRLLLLALLPLAVFAADRTVKIDPSRSFIDVDVDATLNFTAHLDAYQIAMHVDGAGKIKHAVLTFNFTDLKTGNSERDAAMIKWLGGDQPTGRFELGNLAVTPDGQGQASGRLIFHGVTSRIELPVNVIQTGGTYTVTGETTINYKNWGLKVIRRAFVFSVSPDVKIRFKLTGTLVDEPAA